MQPPAQPPGIDPMKGTRKVKPEPVGVKHVQREYTQVRQRFIRLKRVVPWEFGDGGDGRCDKYNLVMLRKSTRIVMLGNEVVIPRLR